MKIITTLRNLADADSRDFNDDDNDPTYDNLCNVERTGESVIVVNCATDGYYDIEVPSGQHGKNFTCDAISWYHLEGFSEETHEHISI